MNVLGSREVWWRSPLGDPDRWTHTSDRTVEMTVDGRPVNLPDAINHVDLFAMLEDPAVAARVLRGEKPYGPAGGADRMVLRVCGACGDEECGVLSAHLTRTDEQVTWADWQWECYYDEPEPQDLPTYTFVAAQYDDAVDEAAARAAEPGHVTLKVAAPPPSNRMPLGLGARRRWRVAALQVQLAEVVGPEPDDLQQVLADLAEAHALAVQDDRSPELLRRLRAISGAELFTLLPAATAEAVTALSGSRPGETVDPSP